MTPRPARPNKRSLRAPLPPEIAPQTTRHRSLRRPSSLSVHPRHQEIISQISPTLKKLRLFARPPASARSPNPPGRTPTTSSRSSEVSQASLTISRREEPALSTLRRPSLTMHKFYRLKRHQTVNTIKSRTLNRLLQWCQSCFCLR